MRPPTAATPIRATRVVTIALAAATVLTQISYPLAHGQLRDHLTVAVVVLFAAAALADAFDRHGWRFAVGFFAITAGLGLAVEIFATSVRTPWGHLPFGGYEYSSGRIGPALAHVPLVVPLAWTAGIYCVYQVAALLAGRRSARIALTALGAVAWDLYLDPQLVTDGQWHWDAPDQGLPGLAAIPWTNYAGWAVTALVMAALVEFLPREGARADLSIGVFLYLWTWLGSVVAHEVLLDGHMLRYSGIYGLVAMALLGVPLMMRLAPAAQEWLLAARTAQHDRRHIASTVPRRPAAPRQAHADSGSRNMAG